MPADAGESTERGPECDIERVQERLAALRALTDEYGFEKGALMHMTGLSAEEVDRLGGVRSAVQEAGQ